MLKDHKIGKNFMEYFAVRSSYIGNSKNTSSKFLSCNLYDGETEIAAKQWDYKTDIIPKENTVVKIQATMEEFKGQPQLIIQRWRQAEPGEYEPGQFIPKCPVNTGELLEELQKHLDMIKHPGLKKLVDMILLDNKEDFITCPASVTHHHAYISGLLHHTNGVCRNALALSANCNLDLLISGAILHDVSKIKEYDWRGCSITMTTEGKLIGHIPLGCMMLEKYRKQVPELDDNTFTALNHLIISHHGKLEWGSPVEPKMKEAIILHNADVMDAQLFKVAKAEAEVGEGEVWTKKIYGLNREFYIL